MKTLQTRVLEALQTTFKLPDENTTPAKERSKMTKIIEDTAKEQILRKYYPWTLD